MPDTDTRYLILDAYPDPQSEGSKQFVGATIGCWLRMDLCKSEDEAVNIAKQNLKGAWVITGVVECRTVDESSYQTRSGDGWELFQQSLIDGFVANVHGCPLEVVFMDDSCAETDVASLDMSRIAESIYMLG